MIFDRFYLFHPPISSLHKNIVVALLPNILATIGVRKQPSSEKLKKLQSVNPNNLLNKERRKSAKHIGK